MKGDSLFILTKSSDCFLCLIKVMKLHTYVNLLTYSHSICCSLCQGLQRRATPHPSELKVMKKVIEERRNEAYTSRPDGEEESPDPQVHTSNCVMIILSSLSAASYHLEI